MRAAARILSSTFDISGACGEGGPKGFHFYRARAAIKKTICFRVNVFMVTTADGLKLSSNNIISRSLREVMGNLFLKYFFC